MAYVLDGIVILIPIIAAVIGYRRGCLQSLVQVVGCLAALALAFVISSPLSTWTYDRLFDERVEAYVSEAVEETTQIPAEERAEPLLEQLPVPFATLLKNGVQLEETLKDIGAITTPTNEQITEALMTKAVRPLTTLTLRAVVFIVLFAFFLLLVALMKRCIKSISELPVIRQADGAFGAFFGFAKGVMWSLIFVVIIQLAVWVLPPNDILSAETLTQTFIICTVAEHNPLAYMI